MSRAEFLSRVRQAVRDGNRPGTAAPLPSRGTVGYQGAGSDPVAHCSAALTAAGGFPSVVPDRASAVARVLELVQAWAATRVLFSGGPFVDGLGLPERLRAVGVQVATVDQLTSETTKETFFAADVGISGVDYLVAETGSVVLLARPAAPRSVSLLPPVHIAVAERSQLLPDLFDLFDRLAPGEMPSCLSLITGPSKTGDIELRLVTGVHGPGEIHVVLVNE